MILLFQIIILQTGTFYHPGNDLIFVYSKHIILITDKRFNVCCCTDILYWRYILEFFGKYAHYESVRIDFRWYRSDFIQ